MFIICFLRQDQTYLTLKKCAQQKKNKGNFLNLPTNHLVSRSAAGFS